LRLMGSLVIGDQRRNMVALTHLEFQLFLGREIAINVAYTE
jgi:hypothetical protein